MKQGPIWNPFAAGVALGLVLLASFYVTGRGLGASGAIQRACAYGLREAAPTWAEENGAMRSYFAEEGGPLRAFIVFEALGILAGAGVAVWTRRSFRVETILAPGGDPRTRWLLAALGGTLSGFAAALGRGCTSGQVLTGGAQLAAGSWIYMGAMFATAYLLAWPLRRQWLGSGERE